MKHRKNKDLVLNINISELLRRIERIFYCILFSIIYILGIGSVGIGLGYIYNIIYKL